MKNKNRFLGFLGLVLILSMILAACGGGEEAAPTEAPVAAAPTTAPVTAPAGEECGTGAPIIPGGDLEKAYAGEYTGTTVTMDGPFSSNDQVKFEDAVKDFETKTGINIDYIGGKGFG